MHLVVPWSRPAKQIPGRARTLPTQSRNIRSFRRRSAEATDADDSVVRTVAGPSGLPHKSTRLLDLTHNGVGGVGLGDCAGFLDHRQRFVTRALRGGDIGQADQICGDARPEADLPAQLR